MLYTFYQTYYFHRATGVHAACTTNTPCSSCDLWNTCGGMQLVSFPDLNALECTAAKIQMQLAGGVDTLGDRTAIAGALSQGGCPLSVDDYLKDEACPVPSGAALDTAKNQMVMSGVVTLASAPSAAALPFLGQSCTDDCCQGGSPAATYCTTHTSCASFMSMKIPDNHAMALGCMNNGYIFDRIINSSSNSPAPMNALPNMVMPMFRDSCKTAITMDVPCLMGSLVFG